MGIALGSNFDVQTALPIDSRLIVADLTARDAINSLQRYEGMLVYVESEETNFQLIAGITNGDWVELSGGGGGVTGLVLGDNSNFEKTIGDWSAYADAAAALPVDGTGGSPNITIGITTTSGEVLNGEASLKVQKDAADRQGEGFSLLIAPDLKYRAGTPVSLSFSYLATANFGYGAPANPADPSDIIIQIFDATNSILLNPNPGYLDGSGFFKCQFQIPTTCLSLRVVAHIATTNASAWDFMADDFTLDLAASEYVKSLSDWVSYTPVFTGFGTVTGIEVQYRQNGDNYEFRGKFASGTATAVEGRMSYPLGIVSADTSKIPTIQVVGIGAANFVGAVTGTVLAEPSTTYMTFGRQAASEAGLTKRLGNQLLGSGNIFSFTASIPMQGLTSGVSHPAAIGLNAQVVMRAIKNGGAIAANTIIPSWTTVEKDSVGSFNSTTGVYTVKVPGDYFVDFYSQQTAASTNGVNIYLNGSAKVSAGPEANTIYKSISTTLVNLKYGDTIDVRNSLSRTIASNNDGTYLSIYKIGSGTQPYAPKVAYIKDVKAANTEGGTFTSGAWQTRTLNTIEGDASFVSLASSQFTLQPGTYDIDAMVPSYQVGRVKAKLRQTSGTAADIIIGQSSANSGAAVVQTNAPITGRFSISVATTYEIQHRCQTTKATTGFGIASNFGVGEVYTQVKITKVL